LRSDYLDQARRTRLGALTLTTVLHAAILAGLVMSIARPPVAAQPSLTVLEVASIPANMTPDAPKPAQPIRVTPTLPKPVTVPPPILALPVSGEVDSALVDQADAAATGGACDLTAPVQAALQASDAVRTALPRIPRAERSVANAIMVWKATWLAGDGQLDLEAIRAVREVVTATIAAATPECRLQMQAGPRLLLLPQADDTVVLAVGSGTWRWQDLVDTAEPPMLAHADQGQIRTDHVAGFLPAASIALP
jgi:hypothetical protein